LGFALRFFCAAALETDLVMVLASCCYARSVTAFPREVEETRGLAHEPLSRNGKALGDLPCGFGSGLLYRPVGVARQVYIHLAELRGMRNVGIERLLRELRLDLPGLLN